MRRRAWDDPFDFRVNYTENLASRPVYKLSNKLTARAVNNQSLVDTYAGLVDKNSAAPGGMS